MAGKLTISIDLELAWGFWDILTPDILRLSEAAERPICDRLLELFDRYHTRTTRTSVPSPPRRATRSRGSGCTTRG